MIKGIEGVKERLKTNLGIILYNFFTMSRVDAETTKKTSFYSMGLISKSNELTIEKQGAGWDLLHENEEKKKRIANKKPFPFLFWNFCKIYYSDSLFLHKFWHAWTSSLNFIYWFSNPIFSTSNKYLHFHFSFELVRCSWCCKIWVREWFP